MRTRQLTARARARRLEIPVLKSGPNESIRGATWQRFGRNEITEGPSWESK